MRRTRFEADCALCAAIDALGQGAAGGRLEERRGRGRRRWGRRLRAAVADECGAATAEYAVILLAAVGFAGLLLVILRGDEVKSMLTDLVHRALTTAG
jgi:Flp pilus assembly pilin Flp